MIKIETSKHNDLNYIIMDNISLQQETHDIEDRLKTLTFKSVNKGGSTKSKTQKSAIEGSRSLQAVARLD